MVLIILVFRLQFLLKRSQDFLKKIRQIAYSKLSVEEFTWQNFVKKVRKLDDLSNFGPYQRRFTQVSGQFNWCFKKDEFSKPFDSTKLEDFQNVLIQKFKLDQKWGDLEVCKGCKS